MKKFLLIVALAGLAACTTRHHPPSLPSLTGQWYWVQSNHDFNWYARSSGLYKTLTFTGSGSVYISHNDSAGGLSPMVYFPVLSDTVTDTTPYRLGPAPVGLTPGTFPAVWIDRYPYQYWRSGDTLVFATGPNLPQPEQAMYLRNNSYHQ